MGKASSSKKVARVAKAGGKAGHRTTRPLGFPLSVGALIVVGLALVAFVKVNRTAADNTPPRQTVTDANGQVTKTGDHFHEAIGFYVCGQWAPNLTDAVPASNGIHTLGDGIISIQPTTPDAAGKNAKLGLFLSDVGVTLTDDTLTFPPGVAVPAAKSGDSSTSTTTTAAPTTTTTTAAPTSTAPGATTTTSSTTPAPPASFSESGQCDGKPATLRVAEWTASFGPDGRTPTTEPPSHVYTKNFSDIRLDEDLASLTVFYGPADAKIPVPQSTPNLLHLQDLGQTPTTPTPSVPGVPSGVPSPSTPGSSPESPAASTPATSAPATSTP